MATNMQRIQAIGDALVNGTATAQQLDAFGEALYGVSPAAWAELTNQEKLEVTIKKLRQFANYTIKQYKDEVARQAINNPADELPEAP